MPSIVLASIIMSRWQFLIPVVLLVSAVILIWIAIRALSSLKREEDVHEDTRTEKTSEVRNKRFRLLICLWVGITLGFLGIVVTFFLIRYSAIIFPNPGKAN